MSNFLNSTYSPAADAALDEPSVGELTTPAESEPAERRISRGPEPAPKLFHYVLMVYLFLYCTRLPELFPQIRASLGATVILLAGAFATGRGTAILQSKVGKILVAFTVWTALCVPFSFWIGGSVDQLKVTLQSLLLVAFMIGFIRTTREVRNTMYTIGAAMGTVAVLSLSTYQVGGLQGDRLGFGESGSLQDPNYMALYLLIGLPFLYLGATKGRVPLRILFFCMIPPVMAAIARSGSRMALILFVVALCIFLVQSSQKERVGVIVVITAIVMVALPLLPQGVVERFTTFLESKQTSTSVSSPKAGSSEAAESAQSRYELLMRSLELTARYPLFGVGPGQFTTADDQLAKKEGDPRGMWHYTHNAYTQTSSESGIIGAVIYIAALFVSYRGLTGIRKRGPTATIRNMAKFIQLSVWMVILGSFFLTLGFGGMPFVVMGLSAAFQMAVAAQIKASRATVAIP